MTLRFWSEQLEGESVHIPTWEGQYHGEIKCAAWTPQVEMPVRYPRSLSRHLETGTFKAQERYWNARNKYEIHQHG